MPPDCDISIIIVSYNCLESLRKCLDSIAKLTGASFETIVVDNNSRDGTKDYIRNADKISAIVSEKNLGFGAAVNLGAKQAHGRYLFILNPDTILPQDCLARFQDFVRLHPDFGIISPVLLHPNGELQISARKFPSRRDLIFGRGSPLFRLGLANETNAGYLNMNADEPVEVPAVSATAVLISASIFNDLGGFDGRFFMYMEDLDLCRRLSEKSMKIWVLPAVKIQHAWRESSRARPYFAAFQHHLSIYKYYKKYYSWQWLYNTGLAMALVAGFVVSAGLIALRSGDKN